MCADICLGPFRLLESIATGGMGEVIAAVHQIHDHPVAVKVMNRTRAEDEHFVHAFREEVRAVARLSHPNVIRVFDSGEVSEEAAARSEGRLIKGSPYLVMERAESALSQVEQSELNWPQVRTILAHVLDGLAHSHARGLIHRDLKPANILFVNDHRGARLVLSDFGLATVQNDDGAIMGTPRYMAPEQIMAARRDQGPWTDLYALGCVAFWLATGQPPFSRGGIGEVLQNHINAEIPPLTPLFAVPDGFDVWVKSLLAKRPEERFRRAADAAVGLARLDEDTEFRDLSFVSRRHRALSRDRSLSARIETTQILYQMVEAKKPANGAVGPGALPRAEMPQDWRYRRSTSTAMELVGVGLGVYGLRQVPLVGRLNERDRLWQCVADACHTGRPHGVILSGPAGIGKSRLASWLAERAHEVGAVDVLRATHSPVATWADGLSRMFADFLGCTGLSLPEIIERVRSLYGRKGSVDADDLHHCIALATLLAGSADPHFDEEKAALQFGSAEKRFFVYQQLLCHLCEVRPLLLVLDDVQWGASTLQFVRYLFEKSGKDKLPLTVVMTFRNEFLEAQDQTEALIAQLLEMPLTEKFELAPLSGEEHKELIHRLLGLEADVASEVAERTAGNPLFAIQIVGDWVERGVLQVGASGFWLAEDEPAPLPQDIHGLLCRRLSHLLGEDVENSSSEALLSLEIAATLGQKVKTEEWAKACQVAGLQADSGLWERMALRTLATQTRQGWSFSHGALRESLLRIAAEAKRLRAHHLSCVEALQELHTPVPEGLTPRLVAHLFAAGEEERALDYFPRAIGHYRSICELDTAQELARQEEETRRRLEVPDKDRRSVLGWMARSSILLHLARYDAAARLFERCEEVCLVLGDEELLAQVLYERACLARNRGHIDEGFEYSARAKALYEKRNDEIGIALVLVGQCWLHFWRNELDEALEAIAGARAISESCGNERHRCFALSTEAVIYGKLEHFEKAFELGRKWLEISRQIGDAEGVILALNFLGESMRSLERYSEAEAYYQRALRQSERSAVDRRALLNLNLGLTLIEQDKFNQARETLQKGVDLAAVATLDSYVFIGNVGLLCCAAGGKDWRVFNELRLRVEFSAKDFDIIDRDLAVTFEKAGLCCLDQGLVDEAQWLLEEALKQWQGLKKATRVQAISARLQAMELAES